MLVRDNSGDERGARILRDAGVLVLLEGPLNRIATYTMEFADGESRLIAALIVDTHGDLHPDDLCDWLDEVNWHAQAHW